LECGTYSGISQEHIFEPLGIRASFYIRPDLQRRIVNLAFREEDRKLSPWDDQVEIIERDEKKRRNSLNSYHRVLNSSLSVRVLLGGVGVYTSMRDYLTILRHVLQLNGKSGSELCLANSHGP